MRRVVARHAGDACRLCCNQVCMCRWRCVCVLCVRVSQVVASATAPTHAYGPRDAHTHIAEQSVSIILAVLTSCIRALPQQALVILRACVRV